MSSNRCVTMNTATKYFDDGEIGFGHAGEHGDQAACISIIDLQVWR